MWIFIDFSPSFPTLNATSHGMENISTLRIPLVALDFQSESREEL